MKKQLFIISSLIIFSLFSYGQDLKKSKSSNFFTALSFGPAFPVGVFGSKDATLYSDAGLAKVGYNLNLNSGYHFNETFGLASTIFYSRFTLDETAVNKFFNGSSPSTIATADHWQYWGINIGPMATIPVNDKLFVDFKLLGGYGRANAPVVKFQLEGHPDIVTSQAWSDAFTWQIGSNLRYNFAPNVCFYTNFDYNYMKPNFKINVASTTESVNQRMMVVDLNFGVGYNF